MSFSELFNRLDEHIRNFETAEEDFVSHYCSLDAGLKIVESSQLWMTHHKYMNDPSEIGYGVELISDCLKLKLPVQYNPQITNFRKHINNNYHSLITSFLMKCDYLPGWRYYGDNGKGVAIRFREEAFVGKKFPLTIATSSIIYDQVQQKRLIVDLIEIFLQYPQTREHFVDLTTHLASLIPIFKINDYQDEHEWRVFSSIIKIENKYVPYPLPDSLLVESRNKPTYKILNFALDDIVDITFGPCCDNIFAEHKFRELFMRKGLVDEKIKEISFKNSVKQYRDSE